ncbi:hypothetical protein J8273_5996 [Carpediemonas membranifera]|uniref:RIB43A-like with coiled-coils protein 2 n=1 Tax=Carpediemonas membranifera TaxID=201153 RepID=A0A8J6B474_9EUKA|nr:hypothetical protein J8273_5996 [Carpediemonas membranifera]|eukprot:KAG9392639.1 hypothetical protein J8273_5996 [Carpediemonas membranifera]
MLFGDPDFEERERKNIEKRRQLEAERRQRILDPRQRQLGVDADTLQKQIEEKRERERREKEEELSYAQYLEAVEARIMAMEAATMDQKRKQNAELNEFRLKHQTYNQRLEFDLNDPKYQHKQGVLREGDEDTRLGVSSGQVMEGEDLTAQERRNKQQKQLRAWLLQQAREREEAERQRKEEELAQEEAVMAGLTVAEQAKARAAAEARRVREQETEMNKRLKEEYEAKVRAEKEREKQEEERQAEYLARSEFLNETHNTTVSAANPNRYIPYNYKGLTREQDDAIRQTVAEQLEEKRRIAQEEAELKAREEQYLESATRAVELEARRVARAEKQRREELAQALAAQAEEQRRQAKSLDDERANKVTDDFFSGFGTSSR